MLLVQFVIYCLSQVHSGYDDATLERIQSTLGPKMTKIKGDYSKVPLWLDCTRQMVPDFVVKDPTDSPVWEVTGAEFTKVSIICQSRNLAQKL